MAGNVPFRAQLPSKKTRPEKPAAFKRLFRLLLVIHVAAMRDGKHQHAICLVVDPINDAPIANAVTQMAGEFARHCCAGAARALTCAKQRASFHASGRAAAA